MEQTLTVRATKGLDLGAFVGFYGNRKRREGEEFVLTDPKHFSAAWMEPIGWSPVATAELLAAPVGEATPPKGKRRHASQEG